ncbi:MAG: hypothetical protein IJ353_06990 [Lachnospiraceae bacterium]|nr:hypothetical protein [Lachnospiraceae bacterium]
MDIKRLKEIVAAAICAPENVEITSEYAKGLEEYIKDNKTTEDVIGLVVSAIDIDRGANYFDYLEGLGKNDLLSEWKRIRESKTVKGEGDENVIKFLFGLLYLSVIQSGCLESIVGSVVATITNCLGTESKGVEVTCYGPIFEDYFIAEVPTKTKFPSWEQLKISPETIKKFSMQMLKSIGSGSYENQHVKNWLNDGMNYAEKEIEKKNIEAKIPASQIEALQGLVKHYSDVEQQLRSTVYQNAFLENKINSLNDEISKLNMHTRELEVKITELQGDVSEKEKDLDRAGKEIEERRKLNQAQVQYREDSQEALLQEIARALKAEYGDYFETQDMPMSEMLGEIYREKLRNIARILEKKGIKVK